MDNFDFEGYMATAHEDINIDLYDMPGTASGGVKGNIILKAKGYKEYAAQFKPFFDSWKERAVQIKHIQEPNTWFKIEENGDVTVRVHFSFYELPKTSGVSVEDMVKLPGAFFSSGYHDYIMRSIVPGSRNISDWRILDFQNFVEEWGEQNLQWLLDDPTSESMQSEL